MLLIYFIPAIEDDYAGPKLEDDKVTIGFMKELMQWYKDQKKLHKKYAYKVCKSFIFIGSKSSCFNLICCRFCTIWIPSYVNNHHLLM